MLLYIESVASRCYINVHLLSRPMTLRSKWEKGRVLCIFFKLQGGYTCCYILYPGPYLENKDNLQPEQKMSLFNQIGTVFFIIVFFNKKTAFLLNFKKSSSKNWTHVFLDECLWCCIVGEMFVTPGAFFQLENWSIKISTSIFQ